MQYNITLWDTWVSLVHYIWNKNDSVGVLFFDIYLLNGTQYKLYLLITEQYVQTFKPKLFPQF